jgi:quercetin dioxygenase-like cupin family protein
MKLALSLALVTLTFAQTNAVLVPDLATAKWEKDDSVLLREDPKTGAMDLLVRYAAGKKLNAHWHNITERMVLLEGKMSVKLGDAAPTEVSPGGVMIVPPKQTHQLSCISATHCTFYVAWDGKLDNHRVE